MSGVFGVVDKNRFGDVKSLMLKMASVQKHQPWYKIEHYVDEANRFALGRIGVGIFNKTPQPVWNDDRSIALVMSGEIYHSSQLGFEDDNRPEPGILRLYQSEGEGFAARLKGAFILAIWDGYAQKLVIANDRFGMYNLFYAQVKGRFIFAPEMKGILCDGQVGCQPDWTAFAQSMRFQHLLGDRTFFEGVHLLPGASVLVFDARAGQVSIRPYWTYAEMPHRPNLAFEEAVEETGRLMRAAVRRLSGDTYRPGVFLSGGLDSRTIIAMIERKPVASLTFGAAKSRDAVYGGKIAKKVRSEHHWINLPDGKWVIDHADEHLELTEGYHSWIHMHGISGLPLAREVMDCNLTGWDGGTVMGHPESTDALQSDPVSEDAFLAHQYHLYIQRFTWPGLTEAEERLLYHDGVRNQLLGVAFDSFRSELEKYANFRRDVRHEFFYIDNHCRRLTHNMVVFGRSHIEFRFPFFDYDLFDFVYSLPNSFRTGRRLYLAMLMKEIPNVVGIPYANDELPPRAGNQVLTKIWYRLKRAMNNHIYPLFPDYQTLYADYENYLRGDLREWAEGILLDGRLADRQIFNNSFIETLWKRHLSNREIHTIGKFAHIMTYEMMLRRFCDTR